MVNTNILLLLRRHYRQHHYRQHSPLQPLRLLFPLPFVDHETNIEERVVILHQELVRPAAAIVRQTGEQSAVRAKRPSYAPERDRYMEITCRCRLRFL